MKKVPLTNLQPGLLLDEDLLSTNLQMLLRKGSKLTEYIIDKLRERGIEYVVTSSNQFAAKSEVTLDEHHFLVQLRKNINRIYERAEITNIVPIEGADQVVEAIRDVFRASRMGVFKNIDVLESEIEVFLQAVDHSAGKAINTHLVPNYSDFLFWHSMNVAALMIIVFRDDPFWSSQINDIALGTAIHNIGMMRIPVSVFNKPEQLTQREFAMVMEHPRYSYLMIKECTALGIDAQRMILEHHERFDGNGYPQRLCGDTIHPLALMLAICDTFIALTSERLHRKRMSPNQAISNIIIRSFDVFGSDTVNTFLRFVGLYPVGSIVRLNDERYGVVYAISADHPTRPVVKVLFDKNYNPIEPTERIDLSKQSEVYILSPINIYA